MNQMFYNCDNLKYINNLVLLDTKNVKYMTGLFCSFKNLCLFSFNTKDVIKMSIIFYACENLTNLDFTSFDTKNVTDMSYMYF